MYNPKTIANRLGKKVLNRVLSKKGYRLSRAVDFDFFGSLLHEYLRKKGDLFFIQIGANDGKSFDPIYGFVTANHPKVKGIAVEPVKEYFDELKLNYADYPGVITLNIGIHNTKKEMILYRVDPERYGDLPKFAKGIASFNKDHHQLTNTPVGAMIEEKVECMPLSDLLEEPQVAKVDLLQIDTEGYDSEIVLNMDFKTVKPDIIHFEHGIPDGIITKEKFQQVADVLHENGYEIWMDAYDATAYRRELLIEL